MTPTTKSKTKRVPSAVQKFKRDLKARHKDLKRQLQSAERDIRSLGGKKKKINKILKGCKTCV